MEGNSHYLNEKSVQPANQPAKRAQGLGGSGRTSNPSGTKIIGGTFQVRNQEKGARFEWKSRKKGKTRGRSFDSKSD